MFRAHRSHPETDFTIIANGALQNTGLSLLAIGLLSHLLSLKDGSKMDTPYLSKRFKEGKRAIDLAKQELRDLRYMVSRRYQDARGQVVTDVDVYDVPQAEEFSQVAPMSDAPDIGQPSIGSPNIGAADTTPKGVKELEENTNPPSDGDEPGSVEAEPVRGGREDSREEDNPNDDKPENQAVEAPESHQDAPKGVGAGYQSEENSEPHSVALIASIGRSEPRLSVGVAEMGKVVPLVEEWRKRGASDSQIREALTAGLPDEIKSPVALMKSRLERKMPAHRPAVAASPKTASKCRACGGQTQTADLCKGCLGSSRFVENPTASAAAAKGAALARQLMAGRS
ncbi:hypothetical protein [Microtetraspora malaysiensis]|uniref:hypothetical protein n=1 Tax=Microtetraspora malaysiensis TaxID=161358 RepID=UPI003D8D2278